jgi:hypothetical protein
MSSTHCGEGWVGTRRGLNVFADKEIYGGSSISLVCNPILNEPRGVFFNILRRSRQKKFPPQEERFFIASSAWKCRSWRRLFALPWNCQRSRTRCWRQRDGTSTRQKAGIKRSGPYANRLHEACDLKNERSYAPASTLRLNAVNEGKFTFYLLFH